MTSYKDGAGNTVQNTIVFSLIPVNLLQGNVDSRR